MSRTTKVRRKQIRIPKYHMSINRHHQIPKHGSTTQNSITDRGIYQDTVGDPSSDTAPLIINPRTSPHPWRPSHPSGKRSTLKRTTGTQASKFSNIRTSRDRSGVSRTPKKSDRSHSHLHACIHDAIPRKQSRWPSSKRDLLPPEDQALIPNQYRKQKEPARTAKYWKCNERIVA
jgi:hypothetical protein